MRLSHSIATCVCIALAACSGRDEVSPAPTTVTPLPAARPDAGARPALPAANDPLRDQPDLPPERRAVAVIGGQRRIVDADAAVAAGYTLIDLRDDWTPYIFQPAKDAQGRELENHYRSIYICLANDQCDEDGEPLPKGEVNYLELFGIPPSLSVIRQRTLDDEQKACFKDVDWDALAAVDRIPYRNPALQRKVTARLDKIEKELEAAREEQGVATLEELLPILPKRTADIDDVLQRRKERAAFAEAEKRLRCEGYLTDKMKHKDGVHDDAMRAAVRRFQRRHMLYADPFLNRTTMAVMKKKPAEANHDALVRALRERVVSATDVVEDGSVDGEDGTAPTYTGLDGQPHPVRNLVAEMTEATLTQLDLDAPEKSRAFFDRFGPDDFKWMRAAVRLPRLPEYYAEHMDLSFEIDRGDVWYDPAWDLKTGALAYQHRANLPKLTVYLTYNDQRFALVKWPTTIGGWRAEQAGNGYEYWRYKESDVGPRVIRHIEAAPTWIPPESTPLRALVKGKTVNGSWASIVNYDEMGPGYLSAYGLVAGYLVVPREGGKDWDNGIRVHGSSDYMSIMSQAGYSHGCHRLLNHLAVRLYDFVLNHRHMRVNGDQPLAASRQFLYKDDVYEIRMASRGFEYELTPPLPVEVLRGRIRGHAQHPIGGYLLKPDLKYPPGPVPIPGKDTAESRAGDGGGGGTTEVEEGGDTP